MKCGHSYIVHSKNGIEIGKKPKSNILLNCLSLILKSTLYILTLLILGCNSDVYSHLMYHYFSFTQISPRAIINLKIRLIIDGIVELNTYGY